MTRRRRASLVLTTLSALLLLLAHSTVAQEERIPTAAHVEHHAVAAFRQHYNIGAAVVDNGCHTCRAGNCSHAVENKRPGVFCGDLALTFHPCCCSFRNECMTTIFSDSCECFNSEEEEELLTTRFYLFAILTLVAWVLLIYDKMCGGPYKVANSSHVLLANSPSAVRSLAGSESDEDVNDIDLNDNDDDDTNEHIDTSSAQIELTVLSSPRAANSISSSTNANASESVTSEPRATSAPAGSHDVLPSAAAAAVADNDSTVSV